MIRTIVLLLLMMTTLPWLGAVDAPPVFTDAEWSKAQPAATVVAPTGTTPTAPSVGASIASLAVGLLVVIGLAVGLGWAAKRFGVQRFMARRGAHLELLETLAVAPKRQLCLVRFGDQAVLVGVSEQGFTALGTQVLAALPTAAPVVPSPPAPAPAAPVDTRFANTLAQALGRRS